jgi:glycosyltransferase involved in cell wall biosynthesis
MKVAMLATDSREFLREYHNPEPCFGTAPEALLEVVPEFTDIQMHVISCWQKPMRAPQKLANNIWLHGLVVPKIGWLRTGYQGCIRAVRKKIQALRPDIVHGQGTERDCGICAALSGFPNVVTIHGNMAVLARLQKARFGSFMWCAARLENFTLKRTGGVFCNSQYTEDLVKPRARRVWRVPNSIRAQFFSAPPGVADSSRCVLVNVGVISQRKQQLELLEMAAEWHRKGLHFELRFVGMADPHSEYVRRFLNRIEAAEKVGYARYLGMKSGPELIELFDRSHAIIHVPHEEAFGLVVAEGLARNLKLFAFRVGGVADIASGVDGAALCEPNDWPELSNAVVNWMKRGHPRAVTAATSIRERYHPRTVVRRHLEIYEEVLKTHR